jgi:hypothetical protein
MKNTILILSTILLLSSCYTKRKAIEKFCKSDSVTVTIRDTIKTETIRTDTAFFHSVDTLTLIKDKLIIQYKKVRDSVYLSGECQGDTIFIEKSVKVNTICQPISAYSFNEWLEGQNWFIQAAFMIVFIFALLFAFMTAVNWINKRVSR